MTERYAVVGNPVAHSRSPEIHRAFAQQTGADIRYERLLAPLDDFVGTVERFFSGGGRGLNVTLPFKEQAFAWVDVHDEYAGSAGAVNTIAPFEGGYRGHNTDGLGLVRDLEVNLGVALQGCRILVLGSGGAVRGVLGPLLGRAPAAVVIAGRRAERTRALVDRFEDPRLAAGDAGALDGPFDVVVNGTSAGTTGGGLAFDARVARGALAYDMAYGPAARTFADWARAGGAARIVDGLGMLVEQAAEAFAIWRGVRPATGAVLTAMRAAR